MATPAAASMEPQAASAKGNNMCCRSVCVGVALVAVFAIAKLGMTANNLRGSSSDVTVSIDWNDWTPEDESTRTEPVSVPLFHLAREIGLGVFMEAELGGQYVTMLLDSGSTAMAVLGPDSLPDPKLITTGICPQSSNASSRYNLKVTEGPLPQCSVADFHNKTMRSECSLGAYDPVKALKAFRTAEIWPTPESEFCKVPVKGELCMNYEFFGDGSCFLALMLKDQLSVGGFRQSVPVRAITQMAGMFQEAPSSGIIGLAARELNCANPSDLDSCYPGAMQQLLISQGVDRRLGLCLGRPPLPDNETGDYIDYGTPGLMTLGGIEENLTNGSMHYTKISDHSGRYSVQMLSVGVNDQLVSDNATDFKTTIVDTGSQLLSLPKQTLKAVTEAAWQNTCEVASDCRLNLQLEGACLNLVGVLRCLSNQVTGSKHCYPDLNSIGVSEDTAIIGYAALKDLYLELNLDDFHVGFASRSDKSCNAQCSSFLSEATCSFAESCTWLDSRCTGGISTGGSSSRGSRVASTCFAAQVSNITQNLTDSITQNLTRNITQNLTGNITQKSTR